MKAYVITSSFYGKRFRGFKVFYTTKEQPKLLQKNGRGFTGGKHILEVLSHKFKKFDLVLTDTKQSKIRKVGNKYVVHLTLQDIRLLNGSTFQKKRDIGLKLTNNYFNDLFPKHFSQRDKFFSYERGIFADLLTKDFNPALLSKNDTVALTKFVSKLFLKGAGKNVDVSSVYESKQGIQLMYLQKLVDDFEKKIEKKQSENKWQEYFKKYLLLFQDGYIQKIEKVNIGIQIRFPDFCAVTADDYLDVIEIKVPSTNLLQKDKSHNNYYWSAEISKAISQTEKYIDQITKHADAIRTHLADKYSIQLRIIKPRGIIIAGNSNQFEKIREKADDFRLLNGGLKNITIVPYDELARRLKNMIHVITNLDTKKRERKKRKAKTGKKA